MSPLARLRRYARSSLELLRGHATFRSAGPAVSVFGSARFAQDHPACRLAERVGAALARAGFTVISGAGPGVMEAVSRGAKRAGGRTIGAGIVIPSEQRSNPWVDRFVNFDSFTTRKVMLIEYSAGFVVMPGGFGTLDELTDVLNLVQSGKMAPAPVVLMDREFWAGFLEFCRETLVGSGAVSEAFLDSIHLADTPEEAVTAITRAGARASGTAHEHAPDNQREQRAVDGEAQVAETPEHVE